MSAELLLRRIDEQIERLRANDPKMSERKILLSEKLGLATIRRIRARGQIPGPLTLARLETALRLPPSYLIEAVTDREAAATPMALVKVFVIGAVQAGVYREAVQWNSEDWYSITAPADYRYPGKERVGLEVRGDSMNLLYPDGSIVLVIRFSDLARSPIPGERVVVLRRSLATGEFEATLKEYRIDGAGRHILWPRSTAPEFQEPFILGAADLPISEGHEAFPTIVTAGDPGDPAGERNFVISALVVGMYRPET